MARDQKVHRKVRKLVDDYLEAVKYFDELVKLTGIKLDETKESAKLNYFMLNCKPPTEVDLKRVEKLTKMVNVTLKHHPLISPPKIDHAGLGDDAEQGHTGLRGEERQGEFEDVVDVPLRKSSKKSSDRGIAVGGKGTRRSRNRHN